LLTARTLTCHWRGTSSVSVASSLSLGVVLDKHPGWGRLACGGTSAVGFRKSPLGDGTGHDPLLSSHRC
jgi:hypothetical protein